MVETHDKRRRTNRRNFLKVSAAVAAAIAAPEARATFHFPDDYEVGAHCNLVLWMTQYKNGSGTAEPWTLRQVYTNPLITQGPRPGILDSLVTGRIDDAHNKGYIARAKKEKIKNGIADFQSDPPPGEVDGRVLSMADLVLGKYAHTPYPKTKLEIMLSILHENGLYVPSSYVSDNADVYDTLVSLLYPTDDPPLFALRIKPGTELGDMTFLEMFETRLKDVYKYEPVSFCGLQLAKSAGLFRPIRPIGTGPVAAKNGGVTVMTNHNGHCCEVETTGECSNRADKYCKPVTGGTQCNAMSEPCP